MLMVAFTLALALAPTPAAAQIEEAAAERLMRASGLWEQLGATAAGARAGIEAASRNGLTPLSSDEVQRLLRATDAAFEAGTLRAAVRRALAARVVPTHVPVLEAWLAANWAGASPRSKWPRRGPIAIPTASSAPASRASRRRRKSAASSSTASSRPRAPPRPSPT
ncbi:MAG: hypothetical protein U1F25_05550 [Rubrivivax sp.]